MDKNKIFILQRSELEGRLDPHFYKLEFREIEKRLKNSKWEIKQLGNIIEKVVNGVEIRKYCDKNKKNFRYLRVSDLTEFGLTDKNDKNARFVQVNEIPERIKVQENDFIISRSGSLGLVSSVNEEIKNSILSSHIFKVSLDLQIINPDYLSIFFRTKIGQFQFFKNNNGGVIPEINQLALKSLKIPIPPKEIQNKIVAKMDIAYAEKQEKETQAKRLLESIDNYLLQELGIKLPQEEESNLKQRMFYRNFNEIAGGRWDPNYHQDKYLAIEKALEKGKYPLVKIKNTLTYIKKGVEVGSKLYVDKEKYFLRVADFDNFQIYLKKVKYISNETYLKYKDFQPKKGEILFSKDGTIGFCQVLEENLNGIISSGIIRLETKENVDNYFLSFLLGNCYIKMLFENISIGQIIKHLNVPKFENFKIPLPPLEKQKEIAKQITEIRKQAKQLQVEAKEDLEQTKKEIEDVILYNQ